MTLSYGYTKETEMTVQRLGLPILFAAFFALAALPGCSSAPKTDAAQTTAGTAAAKEDCCAGKDHKDHKDCKDGECKMHDHKAAKMSCCEHKEGECELNTKSACCKHKKEGECPRKKG